MSLTREPASDHELSELRHALRTPLNHILGYSELLIEDAEKEGLADAVPHMQAIHASAQQILELIQTHLSPATPANAETAIQAVRSAIESPLQSVVYAIGVLAQRSTGTVVADVLRMSAAAADLLAFVHGKGIETAGKTRVAVPEEPCLSARASGRLLVVDDNEGNRDMLGRQLERQGYNVTAAEDGPEALSLLARQPFDLVLLDIMMPGMDGVEVLNRLQADPSLREIPVVMISALDELSSAAYCIEHGAEDYLLKPFEPVLLRARLNATLERKRLRDLQRERTRELERMSDQLQRSNEDLKRFAYAASHDLQTPLRNITSHVQLLSRRLKDRLSEDEQQLMSFVVDGAKRMSELVTGLLTYSQVSTSDRPLELVAVDKLVVETVRDLQPLIREARANVTYDSLPSVMADRVQLRQLLQNLVGNAIKYRGEDPPRVHISASQEPDQWHFRVADNGVGIDPKFAESIFEMFRRLHGPDRPGTGIGLAICKRVIERLCGRIWVESTPGQGAVFHFTIPFHPRGGE